MAAPKRTKFEREKDLLEISHLYLQGITQAEIGQSLDVTQQQICYDLKILRKRWLQSSVLNIDLAKAKELARIDHLEREYWVAWEKSKNPVKTKGQKKVDGQVIETTVQAETGTGDPRFLAGVQWCINKRCDIVGMDEVKTLVIDWREQAKAAGIEDPDAIVEQLAAQYTAELLGEHISGGNGDSTEARSKDPA